MYFYFRTAYFLLGCLFFHLNFTSFFSLIVLSFFLYCGFSWTWFCLKCLCEGWYKDYEFWYFFKCSRLMWYSLIVFWNTFFLFEKGMVFLLHLKSLFVSLMIIYSLLLLYFKKVCFDFMGGVSLSLFTPYNLVYTFLGCMFLLYKFTSFFWLVVLVFVIYMKSYTSWICFLLWGLMWYNKWDRHRFLTGSLFIWSVITLMWKMFFLVFGSCVF